MKMRKPLLAALCAATLAAATLPLPATAAESHYNVAPPPPRVEVIPAPRHGFVWAPGYWEARHHRHIWIAGHWEPVRHGHAYRAPRWIERDNRWYFERGRWDRDHDGVPDHRDRAPNNPYRR